MKKIIFWTTTIFVVQLLFLSCSQQEKITVDYRQDIPSMDYQLTSPDQLTVSFNGSVARLEDMELESLKEGVISITPPIKGSWHWDTDTDLVFTPLEDWQLATKYKIKFSSELFPEHITVKNEFSFTTTGFTVSINEPEFYIDPENPSVKRVTCSITGSHPLVTETVAKAPVGAGKDWKDDKAEKGQFVAAAKSVKTAYDSDNNNQKIKSTVVAFSSVQIIQSDWAEYSRLYNKETVIACTDEASGIADPGITFTPKTITDTSFSDSVTESGNNAIRIIFEILVPLITLSIGIIVYIRRRNAQ